MNFLSIVDHDLDFKTHRIFTVTFFHDRIRTVVTDDPSIVSKWILNLESTHPRMDIVGLAITTTTACACGKVATLQLCAGRYCLVFHIIHAEYDDDIPRRLFEFLKNPGFTFVGAGIDADVRKLSDEYGLEVVNAVDLRGLAAAHTGWKDLLNAGLNELAWSVLGMMTVEKPDEVIRSSWDNESLSDDQIKYACVDAFLSSQLGSKLVVGKSA